MLDLGSVDKAFSDSVPSLKKLSISFSKSARISLVIPVPDLGEFEVPKSKESKSDVLGGLRLKLLTDGFGLFCIWLVSGVSGEPPIRLKY